eukprot:scaffold922_cov327-Pinguiococcus_pyrenoidosus.AAC.15
MWRLFTWLVVVAQAAQALRLSRKQLLGLPAAGVVAFGTAVLADEAPEIGYSEATALLRSGRVARVQFFGAFGESADFQMRDGSKVHVKNLDYAAIGDKGPEKLVAEVMLQPCLKRFGRFCIARDLRPLHFQVRDSGVPYSFGFDLSAYRRGPNVMSETVRHIKPRGYGDQTLPPWSRDAQRRDGLALIPPLRHS